MTCRITGGLHRRDSGRLFLLLLGDLLRCPARALCKMTCVLIPSVHLAFCDLHTISVERLSLSLSRISRYSKFRYLGKYSSTSPSWPRLRVHPPPGFIPAVFTGVFERGGAALAAWVAALCAARCDQIRAAASVTQTRCAARRALAARGQKTADSNLESK